MFQSFHISFSLDKACLVCQEQYLRCEDLSNTLDHRYLNAVLLTLSMFQEDNEEKVDTLYDSNLS